MFRGRFLPVLFLTSSKLDQSPFIGFDFYDGLTAYALESPPSLALFTLARSSRLAAALASVILSLSAKGNALNASVSGSGSSLTAGSGGCGGSACASRSVTSPRFTLKMSLYSS